MEIFNRTDDYLFEGYADGRSSPLCACLNAGWRTGLSGVTDEHGTDWGFPEGKGRTGLWVKQHSRAGVREAMRARRFFATRTSGLRVDATLAMDGRTHRMGRTLPVSRGRATFRLDLARDRSWAGRRLDVQVLRPGPEVPEVTEVVPFRVGEPVTFRTRLDAAEGDWVVLRISDPLAAPRHTRPRRPPVQRPRRRLHLAVVVDPCLRRGRRASRPTMFIGHSPRNGPPVPLCDLACGRQRAHPDSRGDPPTVTVAPRRTFLPLLPSGPHGSRSDMTCKYRCGNACDHPEPNRSGHESMRELVERSLARRSLLKTAALGTGAVVVGHSLPAAAADRPTPRMAPISNLNFTPVAPNRRDSVTVPKGFGHHVVVGWGDKVLPGAPRFDLRKQTPQSAAAQFGYNCDYVGVLPLSRTRALLVANHEYTNEELMFPPGVYDDETIRQIAMASHGMSVVEIRRDSRTSGAWRQVPVSRTRYNRRVTVSTPMRLTGPAAGHPRLQTSADPSGRVVLGTLNNCAGGMTPWGTVLSGEENFNQYFEASAATTAKYAASYARYGISGANEGRNWKASDPRFDLSKEPHEPFRFGWIVEIDPQRPNAKPRKLTMLGRMKHEGANVSVDRTGRVAVYMGDDERGDYIYKFVSRDPMATGDNARARRQNRGLLEHGTLYVAKFTGDGAEDGEYDGAGRWLPLTSDTRSFVEGMSVAEVLIDTRLAADKLAPTRMDRPEDIETNPVNKKVYCALTNNSQRGTTFPPDEANPITSSMVRSGPGQPLTPATGNRNGYVLELTEARDRPVADTFTWNLMLVCGDPDAPETYFAGYPKDRVSPISCPDNVAFDPEGNLWVSTDGNVLGSNDGLFRVPVTGPERGHVEQFLTVPIGAETCGPLITDDGRSVFVAVQHPGEENGSTFDAPASTWPHTHSCPRPSVVVAYRP